MRISCILSKFYIKPQRLPTYAHPRACCILSKFYIKPQPADINALLNRVVSYRNSTSNHNFLVSHPMAVIVVSYRNSTSNHNMLSIRPVYYWLYLIEILHQTTTLLALSVSSSALYLIEILHQTTTPLPMSLALTSCILSKFYIKPQHLDILQFWRDVVSYRNSTSNHNRNIVTRVAIKLYLIEILHQTTTYLGYNFWHVKLYLIEILHQTTTPLPPF